MNISFFIGSLYGGGAERVVCELASYLSNHGHKVEILAVSKTPKIYPLDNKVSIKFLESLTKSHIKIVRVFEKMFDLYKYINKSNPDIYLVFLPRTIQALFFYRKKIHVPIIISERVDPASYSSRELWRLCKAYRLSDGIVFQTEYAKQFFSNLISPMPPSIVIPNAVNHIPKNSTVEKNVENTIIGVGRFTKQKNFALLIRAFSFIANDYPEIKLKIYGDGPLHADYERLVRDLNLEKRVLFPGFIENIHTEMKEASMFVLSSDYEGIPNALIEAMSIGLPCISTDCGGGGAKLLIENGENGLLVPIGDAQKMAEAIKKILIDNKFAMKISKNAMNIAQKYSPDLIYDKWENFIINIINKHNSNLGM